MPGHPAAGAWGCLRVGSSLLELPLCLEWNQLVGKQELRELLRTPPYRNVEHFVPGQLWDLVHCTVSLRREAYQRSSFHTTTEKDKI